MQGNGNTFYTGTIYAPKALMTFPGNSCINVTNGPVIVDQLYGNGTQGCVNLTSRQRCLHPDAARGRQPRPVGPVAAGQGRRARSAAPIIPALLPSSAARTSSSGR